MTSEKFVAVLPEISTWIDNTLAAHAAQARSVISLGFSRLPKYYPAALLGRAKVIPVATIPKPPLTKMGLPEFAAFEHMAASATTYKDSYFVQDSLLMDESLHFHELVHVVQWAHLGVEGFLMAYADGLARHGYRESPLEVMAYGWQNYFDRNGQSGNVEAAIQGKLNEMFVRPPT